MPLEPERHIDEASELNVAKSCIVVFEAVIVRLGVLLYCTLVGMYFNGNSLEEIDSHARWANDGIGLGKYEEI